MNLRKRFRIHSLDNNEPLSHSRRMTAAQAEALSAYRYRVYCGGKLLDAFNRSDQWPFIWGEPGCVICRSARRFEVVKVKATPFARLTRIWVKRAA